MNGWWQTLDSIDVDWRQPIIQYLMDPSDPADKKVRYFALNYILKGGELLRRGEEGVDLRCIYGKEAKRLLREVHLGVCGSHQAGPKISSFAVMVSSGYLFLKIASVLLRVVSSVRLMDQPSMFQIFSCNLLLSLGLAEAEY